MARRQLVLNVGASKNPTTASFKTNSLRPENHFVLNVGETGALVCWTTRKI